MISYLSASGIKTMLLNTFFQNTVNQFLKFHSVNLADNNQLGNGILRNGYRITLLIRTKFMDTDTQSNVTKLSQNTPLHSKLSCNGALFCVFSKKHLTNMQFRAAILLSTLSKMALVVRSVSRHKNYKEDYL